MTRDASRIPEVLEALRKAWEAQPDLRLGQLITGAAMSRTGIPGSAFSLPDVEMLEALESMTPKDLEPKPLDLDQEDWLARATRGTTAWHAAKKPSRREAWFVTRAKDGQQWWHESKGDLVLYRTHEAAQAKAEELNASEV